MVAIQATFKKKNILGAFGLETRYPLLDKKLTQEYLYLHQV